jgi:hypothetical protein
MNGEKDLGDSEQERTNEKPFLKGWNNLINGFKGGFEKFQQSLETRSKKNKEIWEENSDKINKFFKDIKQEWQHKVKQWNIDMEKKRIESKEQWNAYKNKISKDFKNFQEKSKQDWMDGIKTLRKGFFRAYFWFLLLTIPIIIIVVIVLAVMSRLLG